MVEYLNPPLATVDIQIPAILGGRLVETPAIHIALVDDHQLFRSVLADMLENIPGYKVVVQAGHGLDFVRAVKQGAEVSVAVVDLHMPVMDGYATIAWIRSNAPGTRALALTFELGDEAMERAMRAGACGFLRKDTSKAIFLDALNQVAVLGCYHAPSALEQAQALRAEHQQRRAAALNRITEREIEYIRLVCNEAELTNDQMADHMGVHRRTVDGYRENVYDKCGVKSKAGLVVFAYKWGLVE